MDAAAEEKFLDQLLADLENDKLVLPKRDTVRANQHPIIDRNDTARQEYCDQ